MSLFDDVVVWPVRYRLHKVLRNRDVHSLQFGHVERGLGKRSGRNSSEKLVVIGVQLFKDSQGSRCSDEVDTPRFRIKLDFVGAADAVQRLNDFSGFRIHNDQLPGFVLMATLDAATDEDPMMDRVQTRSMR